MIKFILFFTFINLAGSLYEGQSCISLDRSYGVCRVLTKCTWELQKVKSREVSIRKLPKCGYKNRDVVVCCKSENATSDRSHSTRLYRKSELACEKIKNIPNPMQSGYIVGGSFAHKGEFPHQVLLGFSNEFEIERISYNCGGSLISKNFVLTAAHCVNRDQKRLKLVLLGKTSMNGEDNLKSLKVSPKDIYIHPRFSSRKKYDDIALIKLADYVTFNKYIKPACLRTKPTRTNEPSIISGFGVASSVSSNKSNWLMRADLFEVPLNECRKKYAATGLHKLPDNLRQTQLCATNKNADGMIVDACQGDSGGPLQIKRVHNYQVYYELVGITSFGSGCGSTIPGVYTRISSYLDWIESIVWPKSSLI